MSPAGSEHGDIAMTVGAHLKTFVREHRLGKVYAAETGFLISREPDTVLAPDVAFVRTDRVVHTKRYFPGAPDLAIEVVSPSDTYTSVETKILAWLRAGAHAVVIIDPDQRTVRVHLSERHSFVVADVLSLPDVVPGWELPLREIFEA